MSNFLKVAHFVLRFCILKGIENMLSWLKMTLNLDI